MFRNYFMNGLNSSLPFNVPSTINTMSNISNTSKFIIWVSTILWSIIMLLISYLMYIDIKISVHYSFEIWLATSVTFCILSWISLLS